jgi:sensor c-di-GMP phosphodiesterase-like protein
MSGAIPFDKVKIDKCFIDRIGRPETLPSGSIVQLARTLNLSIVAEGVETYEQVEKIRSLGIALGQGYFFRKPVPSGELLLEALSASDRQAVA